MMLVLGCRLGYSQSLKSHDCQRVSKLKQLKQYEVGNISTLFWSHFCWTEKSLHSKVVLFCFLFINDKGDDDQKSWFPSKSGSIKFLFGILDEIIIDIHKIT